MNLDQRQLLELLSELAGDCGNAWSIGSFGAIGEFMRDESEPATIAASGERFEVLTSRGALRIAPATPLQVIAYDMLTAD